MNILEFGFLGGRLDATNLCKAEIPLITSISYDHTEFLGNDLKQIAFEKASIIKEAVQFFPHIPNEEIFNVVNSLAQDRGASFLQVKQGISNNSDRGKKGPPNIQFFY
ncbi:MAG: hypothetical protein CM1200mP16_04430 [Nitrospina sp.]|nr:MAG: hypothetical protein CM1200mP16_04430 [Nitrospina sp.]